MAKKRGKGKAKAKDKDKEKSREKGKENGGETEPQSSEQVRGWLRTPSFVRPFGLTNLVIART